MKKKDSGFTLIEILIGIALFLVLMVCFLTIIRGGTRESALSSDHFTSSMLTQKVIEDILEELDLNPLGFSSLGIDESSPLMPTAVVDGNTPFFNCVEDRTAPWGKINAQNEGTIDNTFEPLYGQVKNFLVSAVGKKIPVKSSNPENLHLVETSVQFDWKAKVGKGSTLAMCQLFAPIGVKPASISFSFNQPDLEDEIANTFFGNPGNPLSKLITDTGANYQTVLSLGIIHFGTKGFINSNGLKTFMDAVANAKTKAALSYPNKAEEAQAKQNLAKAYFDLGNTCFQMTYSLASEVVYLKDHCEKADLGEQLSDDTDAFATGLENYRRLMATFIDASEKSRYTYSLLLDPSLTGARGVKQQMFVVRRLLDLHRILAVISEKPSGLSEYKTFLSDLGKAFEGRNPYLSRLILQESGFAASVDSLADKHPFLKSVQHVTEDAGKIAKDLLAKYPAPPES